MQFQVPQFIEVEDKIFGPFTFKQFIFIAGGLGCAYLLWRALPLLIAAPLAIAVVGFAAALAFVQYNGRSFLMALETGFYYMIHSKLYLWNNVSHPKAQQKAAEKEGGNEIYIPKLSNSKLHDLAWSLDIKERLGQGISDDDDRLTRGPAAISTPRDVVRDLTQQ
jgi:hypothetical protein